MARKLSSRTRFVFSDTGAAIERRGGAGGDGSSGSMRMGSTPPATGKARFEVPVRHLLVENA